MPVFDAEPGERPERERPGHGPPEGATVKRELKARVPKARAERDRGRARPRGLPRLARKPSGGFTGGPFSKPRTWMRADEARAAREEALRRAAPPVPAPVPGDKPRSAGFKSHGRAGRRGSPALGRVQEPPGRGRLAPRVLQAAAKATAPTSRAKEATARSAASATGESDRVPAAKGATVPIGPREEVATVRPRLQAA
jgi:hypothetical protein